MNEKQIVIRVLSSMVASLHAHLVNDSEVVLHDLDRLPNSIVAISGNLTGRHVGDPATDLLLELHAAGDLRSQIAYQTVLPDGRRLRSSTVVIEDDSGRPILALCINSDVSIWQEINAIASTVLAAGSEIENRKANPTAADPKDSNKERQHEVESYPRDIDELAKRILEQVVFEHDTPVKYMQKDQKVAIVAELKKRGFFGLREAAERAGEVLQVSRFTIYNYLKEVETQESATFREVM